MAGEGEITCTRCGQVHMSGDPCPTYRYEEPSEECVQENEIEDPNPMGECIEFGLGDEEDDGHQVAPEEMQTIWVPTADMDDIRRWPRYSIPRSRDGHNYLAIYDPNLTGRHRLRPLTADGYTAYLRSTNRQDPNIQDSATWGRSVRLTLTVSSLQTSGSQTTLEFNSSSGNRWEFEIYNLDDSQPNWREIITKKLMVLPIQHLRIVQLKTVFLDFMVGTSRMGAAAAVGSGGANWTYGTRVADPNKLAGIGMTYSALNRAWGDPRRYADALLPESDDAIDQAFDDRGIPIFTIYHEFGHLFINTARRRADYSSQEAYQADVDVVQQIRANQDLFDRYRVSSGYATGGGQSQGWGEGFAETYRKWMQGSPLGGGQDGSDVQTLLLRLGFPTPASVRSTISAIERSA
jgi:hypothetical protein